MEESRTSQPEPPNKELHLTRPAHSLRQGRVARRAWSVVLLSSLARPQWCCLAAQKRALQLNSRSVGQTQDHAHRTSDIAMTEQPGTPSSDILWKQYALHVDLYKFYLDLVVKINAFYYVITGSILTYYFQHTTDGLARCALLLPMLFSFGIGGIFFWGAFQLRHTRDEVFAIRDRIGLDTAPELQTLVIFLWVFGAIILLVGFSLAGLLLLHG